MPWKAKIVQERGKGRQAYVSGKQPGTEKIKLNDEVMILTLEEYHAHSAVEKNTSQAGEANSRQDQMSSSSPACPKCGSQAKHVTYGQGQEVWQQWECRNCGWNCNEL